MSLASHSNRTLILGIGNILWGDEGFGVRAVEEFHRRYDADEAVLVLDGGTQGLYLVDYVKEADFLLVFDAIDYGLTPGTLKIVENEEVPRFTGAKKMSLHQTGFQEVLSAALLLGRYPRALTLVGCQPLDPEDWGGPLTEPVRQALAPAATAAATILKRWGIQATPRPTPPEKMALLANDLDLANYERCANP